MRVAVVGAGAFGGWTALSLQERGVQVTLVDAWGPGNSHASSGGETRIIRSMYGEDALSMRMAKRALELWRQRESRWNTRLYYATGALFAGRSPDPFLAATERLNPAVQQLSAKQAAERFPQVDFTGLDTILYEREAGILTARENCRTVVRHFVEAGGTYIPAQAHAPKPGVSRVDLSNGSSLHADRVVFACGSWLIKLFPDVLKRILRPSKQDVLFFGVPAGDNRFAFDAFPCWADFGSPGSFYGLADLHGRGFKIASDERTLPFDPDTDERLLNPDSVDKAREYLHRRFPTLGNAPLLESRVCHYENTPDLGFFVDPHPEMPQMLLVGGGSGHGYKHGPALGEYVADLLLERRAVEPAFRLSRF